MYIDNFKSFSIKFLIFMPIFLSPLSYINKSYSSEIKKPSSDYINNLPDYNYYILGPGDQLSLKVSEFTPSLDSLITINGEGIANFKRLKRKYIQGLTVGELIDILNKEYSRYVKAPQVELSIVKYRPIRIYVNGEVEEPGIRVLQGITNISNQLIDLNLNDVNQNSLNLNDVNNNDLNNIDMSISPIDKSNQNNNFIFPTVFDAIRASDGVTVFADLTNIEVTRINSLSNGGGRIKVNLNLLKSLELKDNSQNIRLYDGDTIFVRKNDEPVISQISAAIKSNLNPKFLSVYIGGAITSPGTVTLSKNSTLVDAVSFAGGTKFLKGPISFLRYNNDGSIDKREFNLAKSSKRGSYKNPFLRKGDIIYVGKSKLSITSEVLSEITSPISSIVTTYGFYKLITN